MKTCYGKIKNGKLLLAPSVILRNGNITFNDESLYIQCGYKRIEYTSPPNNKDGYNLISTWEESDDSIVQVWKYDTISDDYSGEMLVAVRDFYSRSKLLLSEVKCNFSNNNALIEQILENEKLVNLIYTYKDEKINTHKLLLLLSESPDLIAFFNRINMLKRLETEGYIVTSHAILHTTEDVMTTELSEEMKDLSDEIKDKIDKDVLTIFHLKPKLSQLAALESYETTSNITSYSMAFIYLFTLFDEVLLRMIRLVCLHEKKWLISDNQLIASEILKCQTVDEVHLKLVENKVNELSWGSYLEKLEFLKKRGIQINDDNKELFNDIILYLSKKRNILVHNNGKWSKSVKIELENTIYHENIEIGRNVDYSLSSFEDAIKHLETAVRYLYEQICDKFNFLYLFSFDD